MNKQNLPEIRTLLLTLHKALLEFERKNYEGKFGKVASPGVLLGLLMDNHQFAWLRQISELIVAMDELLESRESADDRKYQDMIAYSKKLFQAKENGNAFEKNYHKAIRHDPAVALLHAKLQTALEKSTAE